MFVVDVIKKALNVKGNHINDYLGVALKVRTNEVKSANACVGSRRKAPASKLVWVEDGVVENVELDAMSHRLFQEFPKAF